MENKKLGRKILSPKEKEEKEKFLANETIEQRTKRVLNPRINKIFYNLDSLISSVKSPRYKLSGEQTEKLLIALQDKYVCLENSFKTSEKKKEVNLL